MTFKSTRLPIAVLSIVLLASGLGCGTVGSDHPVSSIDECEAVPDFLQGTWDFVELVGLDSTDQNYEAMVQKNQTGSLQVLIRADGSTSEWSASLAEVGGLTILSMQPDEGGEGWLLVSIAFDPTTQQLGIRVLSHTTVVEHIRQGLVAGEILETDREELAHLTASTSQLRSYLSSHGHAFDDLYAVLRKRSSS